MRFSFLACSTTSACQMVAYLKGIYPHVSPPEAEVLIAIGGDGFMLEILHKYHHLNLPVYGINCGTIGFLMNEYTPENCLTEQIKLSHKTLIYPLLMSAYTKNKSMEHKYALNEVSLFRQSPQAAKIRVLVDDVIRLDDFIGDGIMVATPAGSTAYNFSVHGPIIPLGANLLALTPISPFRPRRWRGALLPDAARITIDVLESEKRPVSVAADHFHVPGVERVDVWQDRSKPYTLLFDADHNFEARILREQFLQ